MVVKTTVGGKPAEGVSKEEGLDHSSESVVAKKLWRIKQLIDAYPKDTELLNQELNSSMVLVSSLDVIWQQKVGKVIEPIFSDPNFLDVSIAAIKLVEHGADVPTASLISFMERSSTTKDKLERLVQAIVSSPHKTKVEMLEHHLETTSNFDLLLTIFSSPVIVPEVRALAGKGILRVIDESVVAINTELKKVYEMGVKCHQCLKVLQFGEKMSDIVSAINKKLKEMALYYSIVKGDETEKKNYKDLKSMFSSFKQTEMESSIADELIKIALDKRNDLKYRIAALHVALTVQGTATLPQSFGRKTLLNHFCLCLMTLLNIWR
ncbi:MAG: hypothetical protein QW035_03965 [Candidatus Anstonellales archaeon]